MYIKKIIPSAISSLRIILSFALFYSFLNEMRVLSIIIFITALFTDYLDGLLARKFEVTSNYGAYLDTAADFILTATIFSAFIITGLYPYWILILIIFMFLQFILTSGTVKPIYDPVGKYYGSFLFASVLVTLAIPFSYVIRILIILIVLFSSISLLTRFYSLYKNKLKHI